MTINKRQITLVAIVGAIQIRRVSPCSKNNGVVPAPDSDMRELEENNLFGTGRRSLDADVDDQYVDYSQQPLTTWTSSTSQEVQPPRRTTLSPKFIRIIQQFIPVTRIIKISSKRKRPKFRTRKKSTAATSTNATSNTSGTSGTKPIDGLNRSKYSRRLQDILGRQVDDDFDKLNDRNEDSPPGIDILSDMFRKVGGSLKESLKEDSYLFKWRSIYTVKETEPTTESQQKMQKDFPEKEKLLQTILKNPAIISRLRQRGAALNEVHTIEDMNSLLLENMDILEKALEDETKQNTKASTAPLMNDLEKQLEKYSSSELEMAMEDDERLAKIIMAMKKPKLDTVKKEQEKVKQGLMQKELLRHVLSFTSAKLMVTEKNSLPLVQSGGKTTIQEKFELENLMLNRLTSGEVKENQRELDESSSDGFQLERHIPLAKQFTISDRVDGERKDLNSKHVDKIISTTQVSKTKSTGKRSEILQALASTETVEFKDNFEEGTETDVDEENTTFTRVSKLENIKGFEPSNNGSEIKVGTKFDQEKDNEKIVEKIENRTKVPQDSNLESFHMTVDSEQRNPTPLRATKFSVTNSTNRSDILESSRNETTVKDVTKLPDTLKEEKEVKVLPNAPSHVYVPLCKRNGLNPDYHVPRFCGLYTWCHFNIDEDVWKHRRCKCLAGLYFDIRGFCNVRHSAQGTDHCIEDVPEEVRDSLNMDKTKCGSS